MDGKACPICAWTPDNPDYVFLYESDYWRVVLAPNQCLVGRCIVHLKRHTGDLADLTAEEGVEFWQILRRIETALRTAFDVTLFNWGCYMNLSYRENPPQPHIHWWAVPRYNHPVTVGTMVFTDPDFGSPYDHGRWLETPPDIRRQIVEQLELA